MQGHAGSNLVPVIAANRIGVESVEPCSENGGQSSSLSFYGSSFITDNTGAIIVEANRTDEQVLTASFDLDQYAKDRLSWGLFRDRRPEMYQDIVK
jgi:N-carbamoylputrescine amidase